MFNHRHKNDIIDVVLITLTWTLTNIYASVKKLIYLRRTRQQKRLHIIERYLSLRVRVYG